MKSATRHQPRLNLAPVMMISALALASCTNLRPLKGGKALISPGPSGSVQQSLMQGDNPAQPSRQNQEIIKTRSYALPAGSRIDQSSSPRSLALDSNGPSVSIILSAPMPVVEREEVRADAQLGASQKDTARELGMKLGSLRSITWIGVVLFILGGASLVWPPLKAVIGSVTTSVAILLGGLALMVLPTLVVGNELLILGGVALTAGAWFLAHRHGQLRGLLATYTTNPAVDHVSPGDSNGQVKSTSQN